MPSKLVSCKKKPNSSAAEILTDNYQIALEKLQENECLVLSKESPLSYETRPIPALHSDRHVLVEIIATGLCGSDVPLLSLNTSSPQTIADTDPFIF